MNAVFARHWIPEIVRSDNGPQYSSHEFALFADSYGFQHSTSSPHYPQSNGQAERMVQTAKRLLTNSPDPFMALLTYRATSLPWCGLSPAELCMGRQIRITVPQLLKHLVPKWTYLPEFQKNNARFKEDRRLILIADTKPERLWTYHMILTCGCTLVKNLLGAQ